MNTQFGLWCCPCCDGLTEELERQSTADLEVRFCIRCPDVIVQADGDSPWSANGALRWRQLCDRHDESTRVPRGHRIIPLGFQSGILAFGETVILSADAPAGCIRRLVVASSCASGFVLNRIAIGGVAVLDCRTNAHVFLPRRGKNYNAPADHVAQGPALTAPARVELTVQRRGDAERFMACMLVLEAIQ